MKAWLFMLMALLSMPAVAGFSLLLPKITAENSKLVGTITAFKVFKGNDKCYVAIKDPNNAYYSEGFHFIDDAMICSVAKAAFLTGLKVAAVTVVRSGYGANEIISMSVVRAGGVPTWPAAAGYGGRVSDY
ncbi:hypothetical protein ABZR86_12250 [Dyella marensis]|uniref:Uncharacterized protein n=1 Tax=Dyella marensis TaxID=500610 RepID=A0A1I2GWV7_9GAMM|nr:MULTISPECIES: hypothetical protein [Dyella]SFF21096.1 hypothetical protein SAMN02799615_02749 [Dyella marensis]